MNGISGWIGLAALNSFNESIVIAYVDNCFLVIRRIVPQFKIRLALQSDFIRSCYTYINIAIKYIYMYSFTVRKQMIEKLNIESLRRKKDSELSRNIYYV